MSIAQAISNREMYRLIEERDLAMAGLTRGVTVCITYYNEQQEVIQRALDSVRNQTVQPLEIIIIDDGSNQPLEISGAWVVRVTNRGLPAARNTGLMLARGHAFLPLDADDWLDPTYIEKTLPRLEGVDVVLTGLQEHGPKRNGAYLPGYDRHFSLVDEEVLWHYNRFYYCSLFRTQLLRECGGYNPRMAGGWGVNGGYEDWDLWIDLKRRQARFDAVEEHLFNYTTKDESMLTLAEQNREKLVTEMRRHHSR